MKNKFIIFICSLLLYCNFYAQKINILNVEQVEKYNPYLIITCELVNETNREIILPLQYDGKYTYDYILNNYTSYYHISAKPNNVFLNFEIPPPSMSAQFSKLSMDNLLRCPPHSSKRFKIDSSKIERGIYFKNGAKVQKVQIVYSPFLVENKEEYLEDDIKDVIFYDKKIESKYFNLKKAK